MWLWLEATAPARDLPRSREVKAFLKREAEQWRGDARLPPSVVLAMMRHRKKECPTVNRQSFRDPLCLYHGQESITFDIPLHFADKVQIFFSLLHLLIL